MRLNKLKRNFCIVLLIIIGIAAIILRNKQVEISKISAEEKEFGISKDYEQFEDGDEIVENSRDNVLFSAFFLKDSDEDGDAEKYYGTCLELSENTSLYIDMNVRSGGTFTNGKIKIIGNNFKFQGAFPKDRDIPQNYVSTDLKEIRFNEITNGMQKLFFGKITPRTSTKDTNYYSSSENYVILEGTYITADNEEIEIRKTIPLIVDWYGSTQTRIYTNNYTRNDLNSLISEEEEAIYLNYQVRTEETKNKLILKSNHLKGNIPQLNGYDPLEVSAEGTYIVFNYDPENREYTIVKEAVVDENGIVKSPVENGIDSSTKNRYNIYNIKIKYPLEAFKKMDNDRIKLEFTIEEYYECFNNKGEEFAGLEISNVAKKTIKAEYYQYVYVERVYPEDITISIGTYVGKPYYRNIIYKRKPLRLYNGSTLPATEDYYSVYWRYYSGTNGTENKVVLKETENGIVQATDAFIKSDKTRESIDELINIRGIYFSYSGISEFNGDFLTEDGEINIYNVETDELLLSVNNDTIDKYKSQKTMFKFEEEVKHIRVEVEGINKKSYLYIYQIKEFDDDKIYEKYTREEFVNLQEVETNLVGYSGESKIKNIKGTALYPEQYSQTSISLSLPNISTQDTVEGEEIYINALEESSYINRIGWHDGRFLIKIPDEIIDIKINSVKINKSEVEVLFYEIIQNEKGKFIKIYTDSDEKDALSFKITINCDLTPESTMATSYKNFELYAFNDEGTVYIPEVNDIYDLNNNGKVNEKVNYSSTQMLFLSPNTIITNQTITDYDREGTFTLTPQIAKISPSYVNVELKTARIGIQLKNNYSLSTTDFKILGKIPFEGNTDILKGEDLKSEFTVTMLETGIEIPEDIKDIAKVYYSENENPTKALNLESNGWKEKDDVEDWTKIRAYLIDLGDLVLHPDELKRFYYTVQMPDISKINKYSYSQHAVFFSLMTDEGKLRTEIEPNKIGIRISDRFNLKITKYQLHQNKLLEGATYLVREILEDGSRGETRSAVSDENGVLIFNDLFAETKYELLEIQAPEGYEVSSNRVIFTGKMNENGELSIEYEGEVKKEFEVSPERNEFDRYDVIVHVEDEVYGQLELTKYKLNEEEKIKGARYIVTGKNYEDGIMISTDINGFASLDNIALGEIYTIKEFKAPKGYYLNNEEISFKINNNNGIYELERLSGSVKSEQLIEENLKPTLKFVLEDEQIPTYNLLINKVSKGDNIPLSGAKFNLYYGKEKISSLETDANGQILFEGLYEYIEEKGIEQTYTLKEITTPEGYARVKDIEFHVEKINGNLTLITDSLAIKEQNVSGNSVSIMIEDAKSFRLLKVDGESIDSGNGIIYLQGAKFAIYDISNGDNNTTFAKDSKGKIVGKKEIINDKEYYLVETNENGEITANLPEGLYKAVEIVASDEKYDLSRESFTTYRFGIGQNQIDSDVVFSWGKGIGSEDERDHTNVIVGTNDGGAAVGGYYRNDELLIDTDTILTNTNPSKTTDDGVVIKYDTEGNIEWAKSVGGTGNDGVDCMLNVSDGGLIVGLNVSSTSIDFGNGVRCSKTTTSHTPMVVKYDYSGNALWAINTNVTAEIAALLELKDGSIIVGDNKGNFRKYNENGTYEWSKKLDADHKYNAKLATDDGGFIICRDGKITKYSATGNIEWNKTVTGTPRAIFKTNDGGFIIGTTSGYIYKYDASYNLEWSKNIGGEIRGIGQTLSDTYVVAGFFTNTLNINSKVNFTSKGSYDIYIIKLDSQGNAICGSSYGGDGADTIISMSRIDDNGFAITGEYASSRLDFNDNISLLNNGQNDVFCLRISDNSSIPEQSEITAINRRKEFKITTDVKEIGGVKGGTISGEDLFAYEIVKYGDNSIKEVKIEPNTEYEILEITINGNNYEFDVDSDGKVTLPQFENMNENKHIVVTFIRSSNKFTIKKVDSNTSQPLEGVKFTIKSLENDFEQEVVTNARGEVTTQLVYGEYEIIEKEAPEGYIKADSINYRMQAGIDNVLVIENKQFSKVIVHHLLKDRDGNYTETKVADDEILEGKNDEDYSTLPKIDLNNYELEKDSNGEYVFPNNYEGKFVDEIQTVNYYYEEMPSNVIVHHYIEDTYVNVPTNNGAPKEDDIYSGYIGENYTTTHLRDEELSGEYEFCEDRMPENISGEYSDDTIEVTYFYKPVERNVNILKVDEDGNALEGVVFEIDGEEYITDQNGKISIKLNVGEHSVVEKETLDNYKINDSIAPITITKATEDNKEIVIRNELLKGKVNTYHYIENTTEPVELNDGTKAKKEEKVGIVGAFYATKPLDLIKYDVVEEDVENASGKYEITEKNVIYYYNLKDAKVIVNHFIIDEDGNKTRIPVNLKEEGKVAESETINGKVDDEYTTEPILEEELEENYHLLEIPDNANGKMTADTIEVNYYYYRLKDATLIIHHKEKGDMTESTLVEDDIVNTTYSQKYFLKDFIKEIDGYVLDEEFEDEVIIINEDVVERTIYYNPLSKVIVHHIGKNGEEEIELATDELENIVGRTVTSYPKDFDGYVLIERPDKETIEVTKEIQDVYYYYSKESSGVVEKHIDEQTNNILYEEYHKGNVGDNYKIDPKEFVQYKLNNNRLPDNAEGEMKDGELIEVKYYYNKETRVIVYYILRTIEGDSVVEKEIEEVKIEGVEGQEYKTELKEYDDLVFVESSNNTTGTMTAEPIIVYYYYEYGPALVEVHHLDIVSNKDLVEVSYIEGKIGDEYNTKPIIINNYDLVEEKLPENASGNMTKEKVIVNYYYNKKSLVEVKYVDINTGEEIAERVFISGHEGDKYNTTEVDIDKYTLVEEPINKNGIMKNEPITVVYYYKKEEQKINTDISIVINNNNNNDIKIDLNDSKPKETVVVIGDNTPNNQNIVNTDNSTTRNAVNTTPTPNKPAVTSSTDGLVITQDNNKSKTSSIVYDVPNTEKNSYYHIGALLLISAGWYIIVKNKQDDK